MRLTKQTSYALRILMHCAMHPDGNIKAAEIAKTYQITEANVFKAVQILVRGGMLETVRGPAGGLRLARPASEIRIGDLVRITEDAHIRAECFGKVEADCPIQTATPINQMFDHAFDAFIEVLDRHTLQDFIDARPGLLKREAGGSGFPFVRAGGSDDWLARGS